MRLPTLRSVALAVAALLLPAAPAAAATNLSPPQIAGQARFGDQLTATSGTWSGAPTLVEYRWYQCALADCSDAELVATASHGYPSSDAFPYALLVGVAYRVTVRAYQSGVGYSGEVASAIVGPTLPGMPSSTDPPAISGTTRSGSVLTATTGEWANGGAAGNPTVTLEWQRCDAAGTACSTVPDATDPSFLLGSSDVGSRLRVVATASNAGGVAQAASAQSSVVAPSVLALPSVAGTPADGTVLSAEPGAWNGSGLSYGYRWRSCNALGTGCSDISGAVGSSFVPRPSDVGSTVRVVVSASANGSAPTSAESPPSAVVAPRSTVAPAVVGTAIDGEHLVATGGEWNGAISLTRSYRWLRCDAAGANCTDVPEATGASLPLTAAHIGATIRVRVTASRNGASATATSAPSAEVAAVPPTAVDAPTLTGTPRDGETLQATIGTWNGSAPIAHALAWLRCDEAGNACAPIPAATTSTYVASAHDVGHTLRAQVTASNAGGDGMARSGPSSTVAAIAPLSVSPPAIEGSSTAGGSLAARPGTWSGSAPILYTYAWLRCDAGGNGCVEIAGAHAASYALSAADVGARLRLRVTATNANPHAAVATSAPTPTIASAPPRGTDGTDGADGIPGSNGPPGGDGADARPPSLAPTPLLVAAAPDRARVVIGGVVVIRGRAAAPDAPGLPVTVTLRSAFGPAVVARGLVGPKGTFAVALRPRFLSTPEVVVGAGARTARVTTAPVRVVPLVRARFTARRSPDGTNRDLRVTGRLLPGGPAVRLVWQARVSPGSGWHAFCRARAITTRHNGTFTARCGVRGLYRANQYRIVLIAQPGGPFLAAASTAMRARAA